MNKAMFTMYFTLAFFLSNFALAGETTLLCKSSDFNSAQNTGQALTLTFNQQNQLIAANKAAGSWFCDNVSAQDLSEMVRAQGVVTYAIGFGCSEFNGMLTVLDIPAKDLTKATYEFSWDVDDYFRTTKSELSCVQK